MRPLFIYYGMEYTRIRENGNLILFYSSTLVGYPLGCTLYPIPWSIAALAPMLKIDPLIAFQVFSVARGALGLYTVTSTPSELVYCFRILGIMLSKRLHPTPTPPQRQPSPARKSELPILRAFYILLVSWSQFFRDRLGDPIPLALFTMEWSIPQPVGMATINRPVYWVMPWRLPFLP